MQLELLPFELRTLNCNAHANQAHATEQRSGRQNELFQAKSGLVRRRGGIRSAYARVEQRNSFHVTAHALRRRSRIGPAPLPALVSSVLTSDEPDARRAARAALLNPSEVARSSTSMAWSFVRAFASRLTDRELRDESCRIPPANPIIRSMMQRI